MRATCRSSVSTTLADHQRGRFIQWDYRFSLTPGRTYLVLGMGIWETALHVLIRDDKGRPAWCPAGLFEIPVQQFPPHWQFSLREGIDRSGRDLWTRWVAQWGYEELVINSDHSDALMERDPSALVLFNHEHAREEPSEA